MKRNFILRVGAVLLSVGCAAGGMGINTETVQAEETADTATLELQDSQNTTEIEADEITLTAVKLKLDQDLEKVPAVFSDYVDELSAYSVTLVYSDGSEKLLDGEDPSYSLTVTYEDSKDEEQNIHKICHAVVKEASTGKEFADTQEIVLGKVAPDEIRTEEMSTLMLQGKKKWLIVQSVPGVSGSYALNSDKTIKNICYAAENGEVICTQDVLKLQKDTTYQLLIILK